MRLNSRTFLFFLALFPVSALAAPTYEPVLPYGGLDSSTQLWAGSSALNGLTLEEWAQAIDSKIPLAQKGVASGVASLDASGNVTAPLNTAGTVYAGQNAARYFPYTGISQAASPNFTVGSSNGYAPLESNITMIGAHSFGDSQRTFIFGTPYGGNMMGSLLMLGMDQKPLGGLQPAIAPTGTDVTGGISTYPEMDAAAMYTYAGQNAPYVVEGDDILGSDKIGHAVTYDSTHAYFSPALPSQDVARIKQGMHVMTNSIGSTRTNATHYWQPNNDYAGEVTSVASDGSSITVGGWRILGANNTDTTQVPSSTDLDTTTWTYTSPAIFIGVYTHAIDANWQCFLRPNAAQTSSGDANNPYGTDGGMPVNDCEIAEMDLGSSLPDYKGIAKGINVTFNGPNKPALNSYDYLASGTMPNGYVAWNGTLANNFISDGFYAHGNNGVNSGTDSTTGDVIGTAGDTREMAEFIGSSGVQPSGEGSGDKVSLAAFESLIASTTNMGANAASNVAVHWSYLANGTTTDVSTMTGGQTVTTANSKGDIVFNADGSSGLGLFGGASGLGLLVASDGSATSQGNLSMDTGKALFFKNSTSSTAAYFTVDASGNMSLSGQQSGGGGLSVEGKLTPSGGVSGNVSLKTDGAQLSFAPSDGNATTPFMYAANNYTFDFTNSAGAGVILASYEFSGQSVVAQSSLQIPFGTPSSSTASCTTGQLEMDATYFYSCVATNTWHRTINGATW